MAVNGNLSLCAPGSCALSAEHALQRRRIHKGEWMIQMRKDWKSRRCVVLLLLLLGVIVFDGRTQIESFDHIATREAEYSR